MGKLTEVYIIEKTKSYDAQLKDMAKYHVSNLEYSMREFINKYRPFNYDNGKGEALSEDEIRSMLKMAIKDIKWKNISY